MPNLHLDDNEIKRLHDAGFSAAQIGIIMKCSKTTILNHLRKGLKIIKYKYFSLISNY